MVSDCQITFADSDEPQVKRRQSKWIIDVVDPRICCVSLLFPSSCPCFPSCHSLSNCLVCLLSRSFYSLCTRVLRVYKKNVSLRVLLWIIAIADSSVCFLLISGSKLIRLQKNNAFLGSIACNPVQPSLVSLFFFI